MRWQYKVCLFLLLVSWTVFLILAAINTNPQANKTESYMIVYSRIWYYFEHWSISLVMSFVATVFGLFGLGVDIRESDWKLSDLITIEIVDYEENDLN